MSGKIINLENKKKLFQRCVVMICLVIIGTASVEFFSKGSHPHRILLDTDVDTDDLLALLYILKLNRSEFDLQAITISSNAWSDAGHAVNHIYDLLHMMGRDDIAVGVGGEGGILENGTILSNVGGYLPLIEQGITTAGYCRYRQAIPIGVRGRLDTDTNFGFRKGFLPQGRRRYLPLQQPTVQQVMIDKISAGPTTVFIIGSPTNLGIFLMKNPQLKRNVKHIYIMGGSVRSDCQSQRCVDRGNLFTDYTSNPYAEFNIFGDPFAAYQLIHSGIPTTLIPLDATNTIPITQEFFEAFEKNQQTFEAQYCFKSLKIVRDTSFATIFYKNYFMWDPLLAGIATSIMRKPHNQQGENEFAEMEFMNITVVTSNEPYGIFDGSNPFLDGHKTPKFNLSRNGVHSGHVQTGLRDPFCLHKNAKGRCQDGYTKELTGQEAVQVLVAVKAKPNRNKSSSLDREFLKSFLDVLNNPQYSGKFNITTQFPHYKETLYKPDFTGRKLGKNVVFDMDMSAGDFLALLYLLKIPVETINIKAVLITPTGWANGATIDVVYDLLHMMGRDDIPVGLGVLFAMNQTDPIFPGVGDCKYNKAIPHGSGGFLDSDTLYGLARDLPQSPRRYTAESSVEFGAPQNTDHPELRQPLAHEVWQAVVKSLDPGSKVTILTNGPLTTLAEIVASGKNSTSFIQEIIIVGGHIKDNDKDKGNAINVPSNKYAEMNMFLDPLAAKTVFTSGLDITLIPLGIQRKVSTFSRVLESLYLTEKTPEALFAWKLISTLHGLKGSHPRYSHMDIFLGEMIGAVFLGDDRSTLEPTFEMQKLKISAQGIEAEDGQITIDEKQGKLAKVLENVNPKGYYNLFASQLGVRKQSAVVGSFDVQRRMWSKLPNRSGNGS